MELNVGSFATIIAQDPNLLRVTPSSVPQSPRQQLYYSSYISKDICRWNANTLNSMSTSSLPTTPYKISHIHHFHSSNKKISTKERQWYSYRRFRQGKERITDHFILIWFRHWCSSNLQVKFLPNLWHITDRLRAEGACISDVIFKSKDQKNFLIEIEK